MNDHDPATQRLLRKHKLGATIAAGAAVIALGVGGHTIAITVSSNLLSGSTSAASGAKVVPFHRGQQGSSQRVGQVAAGFQPGTGATVTGTAAHKAKAAALAAYPGGTVDRVVALSNGECSVHIIGVN